MLQGLGLGQAVLLMLLHFATEIAMQKETHAAPQVLASALKQTVYSFAESASTSRQASRSALEPSYLSPKRSSVPPSRHQSTAADLLSPHPVTPAMTMRTPHGTTRIVHMRTFHYALRFPPPSQNAIANLNDERCLFSTSPCCCCSCPPRSSIALEMIPAVVTYSSGGTSSIVNSEVGCVAAIISPGRGRAALALAHQPRQAHRPPQRRLDDLKSWCWLLQRYRKVLSLLLMLMLRL